MADQSDVETALIELIAAALYPNGTGADSLPGPPCRVYRGWPNPAALDADLAAGRINVTLFPGDASIRLTTRFAEQWQAPIAPTPSLTATVSGVTASFGGAASPGQLAGLLLDGHPFVYRTRSNDTPALVAANLADSIRHASGTQARIVQLRNTSLNAATLTIPGAGDLLARVVMDRPALLELRRQSQNFRVTCWCPTPAARDVAAAAIDTALAAIQFLTLADTSKARLLFAGGTVFDQSQSAALYRRDLLYSVEYATTRTETQPSLLFGTLVLNAQSITT